ncbi:FirrV-1-A45 [Feldmannia irregularis virus a]|uniref:FirrV-1-A45 n=1 Tax=Feldmannia irregularis virus a TaxID=231992 RepID=Q6XM42_9PHYC|nr:FirrV-1-A45 [Feldmannia irregularis virus a]AAR26869.1 FirrV-1-A45 [Feldmannia irregularis virus a]
MHERDSRIVFEEEGHRYTVDGCSDQWVSVTTLVHSLFQPFDADVVAAKIIDSRAYANGTSKYCGMTAEEIKHGWEESASVARNRGTHMHQQIDMYYTPDQPRGVHYPEYPQFQSFVRDHPHYEPFRVEWRIFDEDVRVCGSVDMVYRDTTSDGYVIVDWKRSKMIRTHNPYARGIHACSSALDDCNFIHYSLQLGIYRYILTKKYSLPVTKCLIVVLHPRQETYHKIPIADVAKNVDQLMCSRLLLS